MAQGSGVLRNSNRTPFAGQRFTGSDIGESPVQKIDVDF